MRLKYINIVIIVLDVIAIINLLLPFGLSICFSKEAGAIGIIGGADGPTAIFLVSKLTSYIPISVLFIINILILILNIRMKYKKN